MKFLTNKGITQKTIITLVIVILTSFCIPAPVQADVGGKLMDPIVKFVVAVFDSLQHVLEYVMIGETHSFMSEVADSYDEDNWTDVERDVLANPQNYNTVTNNEFMDAQWFGIDAVNIPYITYTPELIFSNQVPALDVNFINPSVPGNDDRNIAKQLRPTIASWYVAIRTIAIVGLLSVLIYLGIRMLLSSLAADRAKYKQMLMDWIVAMCLVFVLHYIMSFAQTMAETVTSMFASNTHSNFWVISTNMDGAGFSTYTIIFKSNLMEYVRFMVQAGDLYTKVGFLAMYIMLVIYSIRFTWVYLKRVVNMAFLTLVAPLVALTYPIDKVSDGKAQAFNIWIKEYAYNALIQPIHLLLYLILVGSAIELAAQNPLYGIVALGFIIAAEKLVKKMFGFDKASGGTMGSLAGAAGVTAMAGKMLSDIGHKGPAAGKGKVRTKDSGFQREGKDSGANSPFGAFDKLSADQAIGAGEQGADIIRQRNDSNDNGVEPPPSDGENIPLPPPTEGQADPQGIGGDQGLDLNQGSDLDQGLDLNQGPYQPSETSGNETSQQTLPPPPQTGEDRGFGDTVRQDFANFRARSDRKSDNIRNTLGTKEGRAKLISDKKKEVTRRAIGAWKALPTVGYKAARGTLRTASRVALGAAMGGLGLAIGATTGDGERAVSMALGAGSVGFATGDNLFDASIGKAMPDRSVRDAYGAGKYGNKIDARNAKADKEYFKSEKFDDFYEKYYKDKYTKKELQNITQSYRKAGITSEKDIRKAIKLEDKYRKANPNLSEDDTRKQVQNIVQAYNDMDSQDRRAFTNKEAREDLINNISTLLDGKNQAENRKMAEQIFQGYVDFKNM